MRTRYNTVQEKKDKEQRKLEKGGKGTKCECGHFEPFPAYVYAHWKIELKFTCPVCGREYATKNGVSTLVHVPLAVPGGRKPNDPSKLPDTKEFLKRARGEK